MHESIPAASSPPPSGWPPGISIFFALDGKFPGVGILELSNPPGWGRNWGQMPCPPSKRQHFSLIARSNSNVATRSRCRGWLVLPSRKYLQANILFPGCAFDCRLHVRGRIGTIFCYEYVSGSIRLHARIAQCQYSTVMTICLLVYLDFSITPLCTVLRFNWVSIE